jgi:Uncharacterised nucleotidyltransferase
MMWRQSARLGRILRAAVQPEVDEPALRRLIAGTSLEGLPEAARYHRVVGFVSRALRKLHDVDKETQERLERLSRQALAVHLHVLATLKQAHEALEPIGVPWVVVKGPALSELAYRRPGLRLYQDLDVLIPRDAFAEGLRALESAGFELVDRNWDLIRRLMIGELVVASPGKPEVDVHWDVRYDRDVRRAVTLSTESLVARARPFDVGGVRARTLDPADTVIYLAMHACKQGGDRLIWLKDIERSVANDPPRWEDVVARSLATRVNLFVGVMLLRAQHVLAAAVPDGVLRELFPNRVWKTLLHGLDRAFPPDRSRGFGTPATLLVRSTREDAGSTLATAGRGVLHRGGRLFRDRALGRDTAQDDPDDPASRAFPTGGPGARNRYLEEMLLEP